MKAKDKLAIDEFVEDLFRLKMKKLQKECVATQQEATRQNDPSFPCPLTTRRRRRKYKLLDL